jgi:hypothetical protein
VDRRRVVPTPGAVAEAERDGTRLRKPGAVRFSAHLAFETNRRKGVSRITALFGYRLQPFDYAVRTRSARLSHLRRPPLDLLPLEAPGRPARPRGASAQGGGASPRCPNLSHNVDRVHHGRLTKGRIPADIVYGARKMETR